MGYNDSKDNLRDRNRLVQVWLQPSLYSRSCRRSNGHSHNRTKLYIVGHRI